MEDIYKAPHLKRKDYKVSLDEQNKILESLNDRSDIEAERLKRYMSLPDLTRTEGSPVKAIAERFIELPSLKNLDIIETPEVISPKVVFDLFNFSPDHPARSASDSYYVDADHILRPHTSLMWKYYLELPEVREELEKNGSVGALSYGKCYRRDEIDWQHSNILHQIDGLFVVRNDIKLLGQPELEEILIEAATSLFGPDVKYKFLVDHFPYTDPSLEMNVELNGKWVEILGAGIAHPNVLKNLGFDPEIYNAWAFGFGLDRLAMIKEKLPDIRLLRSTDPRVLKQLADLDHEFQEVSKYPPIVRDISFIVDNATFNINRYYEVVREVIGDELVEEMKLLDEYENVEKFGAGKKSYAFRIVYRSNDRTLTNEEVDALHKAVEKKTAEEFGATVR
jgi:phenylalanyl-tRNA synthetase alpha chain